jgi:hypothetical protein
MSESLSSRPVFRDRLEKSEDAKFSKKKYCDYSNAVLR